MNFFNKKAFQSFFVEKYLNEKKELKKNPIIKKSIKNLEFFKFKK